MNGTPAEHAPNPGGPVSAADKLVAAFELVVSSFEDARVDSVVLCKEDLLQQISSAQHVLNTVWAVQAARLAQAASIEDVRFPDHIAPLGFREHEVRHPIGIHQDEFIGCEIGPMLGWTSGQAIGRVSEASDFITRTPRLFARVGTGEIDPAKVATIHRAIGRTVRSGGDDCGPVAIDLARAVEAALLGDVDPEDDSVEAAAIVQENVDLIARQSTGRLQRRTERILAALDPVSAGKAARKRRRDRVGVFAHPDEEPGLSHVHAILESSVAAKLMAAVDALARDLHDDTTTDKSFAECRADALADLILGNATVTTKLVIQVPVHTGDDRQGGHPQAAGSVFWQGQPSPDSAASHAAGDGRGGWSSGWPSAFVHPITGLAVFPHGNPVPAAVTEDGAGAGVTATKVRVKSQSDLDAEFNELMKTRTTTHPRCSTTTTHPPTGRDLMTDRWTGSAPNHPDQLSRRGDRSDPAPQQPPGWGMGSCRVSESSPPP